MEQMGKHGLLAQRPSAEEAVFLKVIIILGLINGCL